MGKLEVADVQRHLAAPANCRLETIETFSSITSTNTYLLTQAAPAAGHYRVAIADHQTLGRGRHDRRWISAPGAGLCLSFSYTFSQPPAQLPCLTLAIGVAVVRALQDLQVPAVSLKWPNDIVALGGKLGGILTEVRTGGSDAVTVVTGIGLNVRLGGNTDIGSEPGWALRAVDLCSIQSEPPTIELLAGTIIGSLQATFDEFADSGFARFANAWREYDWLSGKEITVDTPAKQVAGVAVGVDRDGALLVDCASGRERVISGSVVLAGQAEPG
ncbi:MAG: biotin--[acetyl-CoA-carboxylase] ligase [Gammaproteobacteria bacterium]|nr:biotin--[acetyl-CoA-carboxylase] ligase [Gammaproteobacteria bacterium]